MTTLPPTSAAPVPSTYSDEEDLPMPPRIAGPIPFDHTTNGSTGPSGAGVVMVNGPEDIARTHNTVESALGVNDPPVATAPLNTVDMPDGGPDDHGVGGPGGTYPASAVAPPPPSAMDPELMSFAVPDGGPPPSNPLEAKMMEGMMNGMPTPPHVPTDEELGMQGMNGAPPLPMPPRRGF